MNDARDPSRSWISRIAVDGLRIIEHADIEPGPGFNLLIGANGSGKTSLLEAIFLAGRGRAMRGRRIDRLQRKGCELLRVVVKIHLGEGRYGRIGIERNGSATRLHVDGRPATGSLELADRLPLQLIHPDLHQLLLSGSLLRRQFIDRGLFHVEPGFLPTWRRYQRALRQRNAALKLRRGVHAWDPELAVQGEQLDDMRSCYISALQPLFARIACALGAGEGIELAYRRGWSPGQALLQALAEGNAADLRVGFTQRGAHRADFGLRRTGADVRDQVSRGQQKMLLCALQLAQAAHLREANGRMGLILVDDLPAELDSLHRRNLLSALVELGVQSWITGTDKVLAAEAAELAPDLRRFHVEQGRITPVV